MLGFILKVKAESYQAMAREASISRLYGAIHYRSDCEQGLICGQRVGGFAIERGKTDGAGE